MCGRVCCIRKYLQLIGFTRSNQCIDECARVREVNILIHQSMYNQQSILPDKKDVVQRHHINNIAQNSPFINVKFYVPHEMYCSLRDA